MALCLAWGGLGLVSPTHAQAVLEIPEPADLEDPPEPFIPAAGKSPVPVVEDEVAGGEDPEAEDSEGLATAEDVEVYIPPVVEPAGDYIPPVVRDAGDLEVDPDEEARSSDAPPLDEPVGSEPTVAVQAEDRVQVAEEEVAEVVEFVNREETGSGVPRQIEVDMTQEQLWEITSPWDGSGVEVHRGNVEGGESKIRVHDGRDEADIKVHGTGESSGVRVRGGANDRPSGIRVHGGSSRGEGPGIVYH
jgi:hypothetical protein